MPLVTQSSGVIKFITWTLFSLGVIFCPVCCLPVFLFLEEPLDLLNVPKEYLDLKKVFSKSRAASLPPHHPYDLQPRSSTLPLPLLGRDSSSWVRRMVPCGLALTIEGWATSLQRIRILCRWCLQAASSSRGLPFLQSWSFATLIIWSASGRGMSGRPLLIPPGVILNIWLCLSACPTPLRSSRHSSMMC